LQGEDLKGESGRIVLERSIDASDLVGRSRDDLRIVLNGDNPDYAVKIRGDIVDPLRLRPEDAFLTIDVGLPLRFDTIPEGHAVLHFEDRFHQDGKPPFGGGIVKCAR
jgi:hypothetical protein